LFILRASKSERGQSKQKTSNVLHQKVVSISNILTHTTEIFQFGHLRFYVYIYEEEKAGEI
jgi:hypothetical protein